MKYYRKDWILYQEIANQGGHLPEDLMLMNENEGNPDENKHIPFIEETKNGYLVKTGKKEMHPEDKEHHTLFMELRIDDTFIFRKNMKVGDVPSHEFVAPKGKKVEAYTFCNLHGLYKYTLK